LNEKSDASSRSRDGHKREGNGYEPTRHVMLAMGTSVSLMLSHEG
jgi:hypothetical protein